MPESIIIHYTNLLHKYQSPQNIALIKFVEAHKDDKVFMKRVKTLNRLHALKERLL